MKNKNQPQDLKEKETFEQVKWHFKVAKKYWKEIEKSINKKELIYEKCFMDNQDVEEEIVKLKIAYLEVYTAWLNLDYIGKQIYPRPEWIDFKYKGKVIKI